MLKYNTIKRYAFLILIAVCALCSYQQHYQMEMKNVSKTLAIIRSKFHKDSEYQPLISSFTIPVIVLLTNKEGCVSDTNAMEEELNKEFGDGIQIVQARYERRSWVERKITSNVYKIADAIYKLIASSLLEQYGKNSKLICKTIDVHIFGFDEKTKSLVRKIIELSDGRSKGPSWMHSKEWQFPLNIKTIAYINCENKKGVKNIKFLENAGKSKVPIQCVKDKASFKKCVDKILYRKKQLAYNEYES
ncbi:MAG: hypothetical protein NMK33_05450 [Candidatus Cardinium sp.]|uniref:hypothetical protein n=1 Tax=Cardinium endosymbiont of Dermatophagoides farinae TaxID=2597823 RepID=UPI0011825722|nr:hypothetical protein [Cardinium endosymbiont of Dermatophagoides farinae]TSJ80858.1 hypothetical protein FPG78_02255 [Cardinium endosymbiont of Dermatophagoides farinae]UWW96863.1 MAG: hypothetical protein NMK33_05450 [Candidatus Cardinium sp.]